MSSALTMKVAPFEISEGDGYHLLRLSGDIGPDSARLFENELPRLMQKPFRSVIVSGEGLEGISSAWLRVLLRLVRDVQMNSKDVRFIHLPLSIQRFFVGEGVGNLIKSCSTLQEALLALGLSAKRGLDVEFINPFLVATVHVLKVQAQVDGRAGTSYLKKETEKLLGDISGMIGLVSDTFKGAVVITFPEETFLRIISRMLGETFTEMNKEIADGAAELTNIIFGQVKIVLNSKGYGIQTALPSVITGRNHTISGLTRGPVVVVPFETDVGPFFIEICMSQ